MGTGPKHLRSGGPGPSIAPAGGIADVTRLCRVQVVGGAGAGPPDHRSPAGAGSTGLRPQTDPVPGGPESRRPLLMNWRPVTAQFHRATALLLSWLAPCPCR